MPKSSTATRKAVFTSRHIKTGGGQRVCLACLAEVLMITLHPGLPDPFLVLERHTSFGDYARAYGDRLAQHYEAGGIIVMPFFPVPMDIAFVHSLNMPIAMKKIGTKDGLEEPVLERSVAGVGLKQDHVLLKTFGNAVLASYFQQLVAKVNWQIRVGLVTLFPKYYSLQEGNITWRLCRTEKEGLHFDIFSQGKPLDTALKSDHRIKLFFNIDTQPRRWRVSYHLREALKACRAHLPAAMPDDINVANWIIDKTGALEDVPAHDVAFPPFSAWLGNAEIVAHEVVYGHRVIAAEYHCHRNDMLNPALCSHTQMKDWIKDAGLALAPDAAAAAAPYAHLKGSYDRALEREQGAQG